jgi:ABC-2 type transport system permease protein
MPYALRPTPYQEFLILLRLHLRLLGRTGGTGKGGPPQGGIGRLLLRPGALMLFGGFVAFVLGSFLSGVASGPDGLTLLTPLMELMASWGTVLLLFFAFPLALNGFTTSSDLKLLLLTPLSPRLILGEKFLELYGTLALVPLIAGFLILIAVGSSLSLGPAYYLMAAIVLLLLPVAPLGIAITLLVAVLRWIPPARARTITALLGALLGIAYYTGLQLLGAGGSARSAALQVSLARGSHAWWQSLPSAWPGDAVAAAGLGHAGEALAYLLATAALAAAVAGVATLLSAHLFATGCATYQEVGRRDRPAPAVAPAPASTAEPHSVFNRRTERARRGRRPAWWPIVGKEWRGMRRDPQLWAPLLYPLFIVGFGFYRAAARGLSAGGGASLLTAGYLYGSLAFLTSFLASFLALSIINREAKTRALLALLPLDARQIVAGKWAACVLPNLILAELLAVAGAVLLQIPLWEAILAVGALAALVVAVCGAMLLITLIFPRLDSDNPRRQVSTAASLLGMIAGFALAGLVIGLLLLTFYLGPRSTPAAAIAGLCLFAILEFVTVIAAAGAPARLEALLHNEGG